MKERIEFLLYKIILKFINMYTRVWKKEQLRKFGSCGNRVIIGGNSTFSNKNIYIGDNVFIGEYASFISTISNIHIGNNVMFGPHGTIIGGDHRTDLLGKYMINITEIEKRHANDKDVYIEDDVWIGSNVTILKGVRIGTGSVIGAGSTVVKDVPPYTIHVGCQGVKEKPRFNDEQISLHKKLLKRVKDDKNVQK